MSFRRSLALSFLEKYASTAINLGSTLVLARLLSPHEIGVFSVGAAVVGIMHSLRDFGVTSYLIQERDVDRDKLRTAFTVTLGLSWLFALLLLAGADWAAGFYGEPGVRQIVWVMAANFVLIPFGSPILALMRREMQFGRLAAIQVASTAVNAGTGIALAATGHGFMSLAWASLAGVAITSGLAFLSRPHVFLFKPGLHQWRSVLAFGSYASANALLGDLRLTAPDLIMGRMLGFEAVGLFSRAIGLIGIFNKVFFEGLQPVLLPALSEKVRRGEDLGETYLRAMEHVSVLYWPFLAFLALMAGPIVEILLGQQWVDAVLLVQILCIGSAVGFPAFLTQPLLMSMGRVRDTFILNALLLPLSVLVFVAGSLYSVEIVAFLTAPVSLVAILIVLRFVGRFISVKVRDVLYATRKSAAVTIAAILVPWLIQMWPGWHDLSPFLGLVIAALAFGLAWLIAIYLTGHPLKEEFRGVMERLPRRASGR